MHYMVLSFVKIFPDVILPIKICLSPFLSTVENHGIRSSELLFHNHGSRLIT